jgi:hypothetical protein
MAQYKIENNNVKEEFYDKELYQNCDSNYYD